MNHLEDPVTHLCEFLFWVGCRVGSRPGEGALNLRWDQVDWVGGWLNWPGGSRTKKTGRVKLIPQVTAILRQLAGRNEKWVFARRNGQRLAYKSALQAFKDTLEKAGLTEVAVGEPGPDHYILHDYKRTAARRVERNPSISRATAKKMVGHKSDAMFDRYTRARDEDVASGWEELSSVTVLGTIDADGNGAEP